MAKPKANLDEYLALKKRVEVAQTKASQAEGALGEVMKQLKKEFDCDSLKEAKKKLKQLEEQESSSNEEFKKEFKKYKRKWIRRIGG